LYCFNLRSRVCVARRLADTDNYRFASLLEDDRSAGGGCGENYVHEGANFEITVNRGFGQIGWQ
jgi:hypothetical protein